MDRRRAESIVNRLSLKYGIPVIEIMSRTRQEAAVRMRQIAWYMLHKIYNMSSTTIGAIFGRDHTTILHGINAVRGSELVREAEEMIPFYPHIHRLNNNNEIIK